MSTLSSVRNVREIITTNEITIHDVPQGGRPREVTLDKGRTYIIPEYQREIKWTRENVQVLIDDLRKGSKFLGTIAMSTAENKRFELIDGQQRLTVITLLIMQLNKEVNMEKRIDNLCEIKNESFPHFQEALKYEFDYSKLENENKNLYDLIIETDIQEQRSSYRNIWETIQERILDMNSAEKEQLLVSLCESQINVIVNEIEGTDTQKKFCVDYFIDINNKSVILESLDIIRAYAFKEDFSTMTGKWVEIQKQCKALEKKVKYNRENLYYQYFVCNVNKEIEYSISKLSNDYRIKETIKVRNKEYASGTYIWDTFSNDKFYSRMLADLVDYLNFINIVISTETGGSDQFKAFFHDENDKLVDETRILNSHTVINSILRNDDLVPKMLVMKFFLEVLRPKKVKSSEYKIISKINIIATLFTLSSKRKGSEIIAGKLLNEKWKEALSDYAIKAFQTAHADIGSTGLLRAIKENGIVTKDSGVHASRRFLSMMDSAHVDSNTLNINEEMFKNENITSGDRNIEHFIINRGYKYALYLADATVDVEISLKKNKQYMASLVNFLLIDSDINKKLGNRPVYEKIEMIESVIASKAIETIIPSEESRKHYYVIKRY